MAVGELVPWLTGECGSPARSLNTWWRRCVVTQLITDPSSAIVPATANTILSDAMGAEAVVREEAVETDADPEAGEDVERHGQAEAPDRLGATPTQGDEHGQRHQRSCHQKRRHDPCRGLRAGRGAVEDRHRYSIGDPRFGKPLEKCLWHGVHFCQARPNDPAFAATGSPWSRATLSFQCYPAPAPSVYAALRCRSSRRPGDLSGSRASLNVPWRVLQVRTYGIARCGLPRRMCRATTPLVTAAHPHHTEAKPSTVSLAMMATATRLTTPKTTT